MSTVTEKTQKIDTSKLKYPSKEKKQKKKIKLKKNMKVLIISILALIAIIIAAFITYDRYEELNEYKVENYELYQYFAGIKFEYTGEIKLKRNGEITELKYKDIVIEVDSTPIYFKEIDNQVLLPKNMALYMPRKENSAYRLPYFSRISVEKGAQFTSAYWQTAEKEIFLEESFLYDGGNLYVLLYETDIEIDGKKITLSPLSYISVSYQGEIYYYDKAKDKYVTIDKHKNDVIATLGTYQINLSTDMILYANNNNKLLIKNSGNLPVYSG